MWLFGLAVLWSAFLLFQVQPMLGKCLLPWYGSSPAVWTTCMLFFQSALLVGYLYAHGIATRMPLRRQAIVHAILLALTLLLLPLAPRPPAEISTGNPAWQILGLLAFSVGLPYVMLSTTGPLLQAWYAAAYPGRSPYWLYALSNVGSLLALLTYPVAFEPNFALAHQTGLWSGGFVGFAVLAALCGWRVAVFSPAKPAPVKKAREASAAGASPVTWTELGTWLALSACGSVLLLGVTNQMCQDVAVVPFLWVMPLALYLVSFIICFENPRWYYRPLFNVLLLLGGFGIAAAVWDPSLRIVDQVALYLFGLFSLCMSCHGELARLKPAANRLTLYFLVISIGGALGGLMTAIVAPWCFLYYWELDIAVAVAALLVWLVQWRQWQAEKKSARQPPTPELAQRQRAANLERAPWGLAVLGVGVIALEVIFGLHIMRPRPGVQAVHRNFFGVLTVEMNQIALKPEETPTEEQAWRLSMALYHGGITHGTQFVPQTDDTQHLAALPTTYYGRNSGVGLAVDRHPARRLPGQKFHVGVVGLGAGTMAAYAGAGDRVTFYDINPLVPELAEQWFTYLSDARARGAEVRVELGDARAVLERQWQASGSQQFDVLVIDAFSGDAIPVHLLTSECMALYAQHLRQEGILAVHVSNRYLDLRPVVRQGALDLNLTSLHFFSHEDTYEGLYDSDWVLVTANAEFIRLAPSLPNYLPWGDRDRPPFRWTDQFSSLLQVLEK